MFAKEQGYDNPRSRYPSTISWYDVSHGYKSFKVLEMVLWYWLGHHSLCWIERFVWIVDCTYLEKSHPFTLGLYQVITCYNSSIPQSTVVINKSLEKFSPWILDSDAFRGITEDKVLLPAKPDQELLGCSPVTSKIWSYGKGDTHLRISWWDLQESYTSGGESC